jgi:hypothetical protein
MEIGDPKTLKFFSDRPILNPGWGFGNPAKARGVPMFLFLRYTYRIRIPIMANLAKARDAKLWV